MLALTIILFATGIYILAKGRIDFWGRREIIRPKSTYIGLSLIILGIFSFFLDIYIVIGLFILTFAAEYFLSRKKEVGIEKNKDTRHSATNLIILTIFAALIAFAFWYFTKI